MTHGYAFKSNHASKKNSQEQKTNRPGSIKSDVGMINTTDEASMVWENRK